MPARSGGHWARSAERIRIADELCPPPRARAERAAAHDLHRTRAGRRFVYRGHARCGRAGEAIRRTAPEGGDTSRDESLSIYASWSVCGFGINVRAHHRVHDPEALDEVAGRL